MKVLNNKLGKLQGITLDYEDGKPLVTLKMEGTEGLDNLQYGLQYEVTIKPHSRRRSLDANAYFHVLNGKIADALRVSKIACKNMLIARYGQCEIYEGKTITYATKAPPEYMSEVESPHSLLIHTEVKNGATIYTYRLYRPSHTLNSYEFSILLEGTIAEAKELGIDTITPNQLERMVKKWHVKG